MDKKSIADHFHQYYQLLNKSAGQSELMVANQIYVPQGYELKPDFRDVATKFFSGVEAVNFSDAKNTANMINDFVKEKTKDKIKQIVGPEKLSSDSRLVLVNAIYLKSKWVHPFEIGVGWPFVFNINE